MSPARANSLRYLAAYLYKLISRTMSDYTTKIGDTFLRVPKLEADGRNYPIYRDRLALSILARGLYEHLAGKAKKPDDPVVRSGPPETLTEEEQKIIDTHNKDLREWTTNEAIVWQQIASTIPDSLFLKIKGKETVKEAWDLLKSDYEKRSKMFMVDLRRRIQDQKCDEGGDVRTHFDTICSMREDLATLGDELSDDNFAAILLGLLPRSYDSYLSAISATLSIMDKKLTPDALILSFIDESDRRSVKTRQTKKEPKDAAFFAGNGRNGSRKFGKGQGGWKKDIECHNCHKRGHMKRDCFARGGGREGQRFNGRNKGGSNTDSANVAEDDEGVWVAFGGDSSDEDLADDEGETWDGGEAAKDNEDDSFWYTGATYIDDLLPIVNPPDHEFLDTGIEPTNWFANAPRINILVQEPDTDSPGVDFDDLPELQSCMDSSDEEDLPPPLVLCSDLSDDEIDIPMSSNTPLDDSDSMPELLICSDSSDDEEMDATDASNEICEPMEMGDGGLAEDEGDDACTNYTFAMLAGYAMGPQDVEIELYDSGATRHMSPYKHQLENYVSIIPKSITAANKRSFQAIGKGDLRIHIPNGKNSTTILLKDVLHCPDIGVTLVSISRVTEAGYSVWFRDTFFRIFDPKKKQIGQIPKTNGLYKVEHPSLYASGGVVAAVATETVSAEDLHRRMGHIAPDAAKRLVTEGAIAGIELDNSTTIKSCDSCAYAKTHRKPINKMRDAPRAAAFGDEIHSDLWGPSPIQTPGHKEYYVSFTDDHTRWTVIDLLRTKDETFRAFLDFEAWAKLHHKVDAFKNFRSDRGGEYMDGEFTKYLASKGTKRLLAPHDTPKYNGVAERLNRIILEKGRAMIHASGLPKNLWGEAVKHAVWLKNRTSTKALPHGMTPYEMLYGNKPHLAGLREWGLKVWVHDSNGTKLDGRAKVGRWIGFDEESNAHRIYWPEKRSVTIERSVKFDDNDVLIPHSAMLEGEKEPTNHTPIRNAPSASPETEDTSNSDSPLQIDENTNFTSNRIILALKMTIWELHSTAQPTNSAQIEANDAGRPQHMSEASIQVKVSQTIDQAHLSSPKDSKQFQMLKKTAHKLKQTLESMKGLRKLEVLTLGWQQL